MKVLVACEESQRVCIAFRNKGHEAYSCDIIDCSGGHPEWHIKDDVLKHLDENWDLIIAHPPCTYLTVAGNKWFDIEKYGIDAINRHLDRENAIDFLWHLQTYLVQESLLKIQSVLCQRDIKSQHKLFSRINSDIVKEKQLAYG